MQVDFGFKKFWLNLVVNIWLYNVSDFGMVIKPDFICPTYNIFQEGPLNATHVHTPAGIIWD